MTKFIATTAHIAAEQQEALRELSKVTHVSIAEWIRRGIDLRLAQEELPRVPSNRKQGWWYEVVPLTFARGRLIHTDGFSVDEFW